MTQFVGSDAVASYVAVRTMGAFAALLAGLLVAGCGVSSAPPSSSMETARHRSPRAPLAANQPSASTSGKGTGGEHLPAVTLGVSVPALIPPREIPALYTCDGENLSLPVRWSGIPADTAELAVFVIRFSPVYHRLFFDWALTGLEPKSKGIAAGGQPPAAVVGLNSFGQLGYSICPTRGSSEAYIVRLLALPRRLSTVPGFDAEAVYLQAERSAKAVGFISATYHRS